MANKKEYALANKQWLEEKAKEEGVMALPRGFIIRWWLKVKPTANTLPDAASLRHTIQDGPLMARNSTLRAEALLWPSVCLT